MKETIYAVRFLDENIATFIFKNNSKYFQMSGKVEKFLDLHGFMVLMGTVSERFVVRMLNTLNNKSTRYSVGSLQSSVGTRLKNDCKKLKMSNLLVKFDIFSDFSFQIRKIRKKASKSSR